MNKILRGMLLLVATSGFAYAGQTVDEFGYNQSLLKAGGTAISMMFTNKDGEQISKDKRLTIVQNKSESFTLRAFKFTSDEDYSFSLPMAVKNERIKVEDPNLYVSNSGSTCNFQLQSISQCSFTLLANYESTVGQTRSVHYDSNDSTIFPSGSQAINILPSNAGGQISGIGSAGIPNILTGIAVSDINSDDNESFTIKVSDLTNVKELHLEYQINDSTIAQFADSNTTQKCATGYTSSQSELECSNTITPLKTGNTTITFDKDNSYWIDINGNRFAYEESQLPSIKVNIGTLYTGYRDGTVFRKGNTAIKLSSGKGVKTLAVDGANHRLYAISGSNIYQQNDFSTSNLDLNKIEKQLPTFDGDQQLAQTLSLTNESDLLLVGTGFGMVYSFNQSTGSWNLESDLLSSVISGETDTYLTKFNYFANEDGNFAVRESNGNWTYASNNIVKESSYSELHISAQNDQVYVAATFAKITGGYSDIFHWENNKLVKVILNSNNPFVDDNYIVSLFNDGNNNLFASGSDGALYQYKIGGNSREWLKVTTTTNITLNSISDIATDKNHNIYLAAGKGGVYKLKKVSNNSYEVIKLKLYSNVNNPTTVVIDNNQ
jgi:hypothetical protein